MNQKDLDFENVHLTQNFIKSLNKEEKNNFITNTLLSFVTSIKLHEKPVNVNGEVDEEALHEILLEFHAKFIMSNESVLDKYFYYLSN